MLLNKVISKLNKRDIYQTKKGITNMIIGTITHILNVMLKNLFTNT